MNREYLGYKRVPPDLWPRQVRRGPPSIRGVQEEGVRDLPPQPYTGTAIFLDRGFQGRSVIITATPSLVIPSGMAWPYIILNPSRSVGLTNFGDLQTTLVTNANGNTQASPLGVANFLTLRLMLEVTACAGTYDFIAQTRNPMTGTWIDTQTVFLAVAGVGNFYANVGAFGNEVDFAVRWNQTAVGAITFRLSWVLKEGTIGSGAGASQTLFVGPNDGVSIVSGWPILEGSSQQFIVAEGVEVWGVGYSTFTINIFQL